MLKNVGITVMMKSQPNWNHPCGITVMKNIQETRTLTMREKEKDIGKEEEAGSDLEVTCVHLNLHSLLLQRTSHLSTPKSDMILIIACNKLKNISSN